MYRMNSPNSQNIKDRILAQIKEQKVTMRPKTYFTVQLVLLGILVFTVLTLSIFLVNFISFSVRISSHDILLGFGVSGFLLFIQTFPWELLILDSIFVAVLLKLLKKFTFGYRNPVLYLFGALLLVTVSVGLAFDRGTGFNDDILERAHRQELPFPVGEVYEYAHRKPPSGSRACACTITAIQGNVLTAFDAEDDDKTPLTIEVSSKNKNLRLLHIGQTIFVVGEFSNGTIKTLGIHPLTKVK